MRAGDMRHLPNVHLNQPDTRQWLAATHRHLRSLLPFS